MGRWTRFCSEIGVDAANPDSVLVKVDPKYFRPTEVDILIGSAKKAETKLGWKPKTLFYDLVEEMTKSDLAAVDNNSIEKD